MKVLIRGTKCWNGVANASRSLRVATASIRAAHLAASDIAPFGPSLLLPPEHSHPPTRAGHEYRIAGALGRAAVASGDVDASVPYNRNAALPPLITCVIRNRMRFVSSRTSTCHPGGWTGAME